MTNVTKIVCTLPQIIESEPEEMGSSWVILIGTPLERDIVERVREWPVLILLKHEMESAGENDPLVTQFSAGIAFPIQLTRRALRWSLLYQQNRFDDSGRGDTIRHSNQGLDILWLW